MAATFRLLDDKKYYAPIVRDSIKKYGFAPEHNLNWFECVGDGSEKYAAIWDDNECLLSFKDARAWYAHVEPIAAVGNRGLRVMEFASAILEDYPSIEKVVVEVCEETLTEMKALLSGYPGLKFRAMNYILRWPIMNLKTFDAALSGSHWKSLRNLVSKLTREYTLRMTDATSVDKKLLHGIINSWKKNRHAHDRAYPERYHALIDSNFEECDHAQVLLVGNVPIGINAGWRIPQSETYYGAIGVHDYSIKNIGHYLYLEDILWMKKNRYAYVNLGGGEENLSSFKNFYKPEAWYDTYNFSIVRA